MTTTKKVETGDREKVLMTIKCLALFVPEVQLPSHSLATPLFFGNQ